MSVLGPGIGEIQVDPVHFSLVKIFADQFRVSSDKEEILRLGRIQLIQRSDQYTGVLLNSYIIDIRIFYRQLIDKFTFSRSDLQMDRVFISESLSPLSLYGSRVLYDPPALCDRLSCSRNISQPHLLHRFCHSSVRT
jgi:hypothetical protein